MPIGTYKHPLFGYARFETQKPVWERGDDISFLSGFDSNVIETLEIGQLAKISPDKEGKIKFHPRARAQLVAALEEIEVKGLLPVLKKYRGAYSRLKKPLREDSSISKEPSNHAFGVAIDLNDTDGQDGLTAAPVAPTFEKYGFCWGATFKDPMHFEIQSFIDEGDVKRIQQGTLSWQPDHETDYRLLHPALLASSASIFDKLHDHLASRNLALGPIRGHRRPAPGQAGAANLLAQNHLPSMAVEVGLFNQDGYVGNAPEYAKIGEVVGSAGLDWHPPDATSGQYARVQLRPTQAWNSLARDSVAAWQKMLKVLEPQAPKVDGLTSPQWSALLEKRYGQASLTPAIYVELFQQYSVKG